jgi:hypothetical protein
VVTVERDEHAIARTVRGRRGGVGRSSGGRCRVSGRWCTGRSGS